MGVEAGKNSTMMWIGDGLSSFLTSDRLSHGFESAYLPSGSAIRTEELQIKIRKFRLINICDCICHDHTFCQ